MKAMKNFMDESARSEKYFSEAGIATAVDSFRIKDNKAIVIGCNRNVGLFEIVHDYSTGKILLERRIWLLKKDDSIEGGYLLKYAKQFYPKPDTLIGKIKNYLDRGY